MQDKNLPVDFDGQRLPASVEAEQSVLGSILIDPACISLVAVQIKPEYFYIPQHREIFKVLTEMFELNIAIDFVAVLERLKKAGVYDEAGGKAYLAQLAQAVPTSANVQTYVGIVRERFYARSLIVAAQEIINDASDSALDAESLLNNAEQRIYDIRSGSQLSGLTHIKDVIRDETYDRLTKMNDPETRDDYIGIPSGFSVLDSIIGGLNKSDMVIIGARPGMGKTAFALCLARNVAVNAKKTVCFFSLEMTRDQLAQRMLSNEASIEGDHLRSGELTPDEWTRLAQAGTVLSETNIYFDESSGITVPEMKAKLRRRKDVGMVVIDYLGLMHAARAKENRVQEISEITRNLKIMAKELNVPVVVCAQLNRGTEKGVKNHRPSLSDLRESGSIEQDADIVMFLYRDTYYDQEGDEVVEKSDPNRAELIIAKNRHGQTGKIDLHWEGKYSRFAGIVYNDD